MLCPGPALGKWLGKEESLPLSHTEGVRLKAQQGQLLFSGAKRQQWDGGKGKLGEREARECFPSGVVELSFEDWKQHIFEVGFKLST